MVPRLLATLDASQAVEPSLREAIEDAAGVLALIETRVDRSYCLSTERLAAICRAALAARSSSAPAELPVSARKLDMTPKEEADLFRQGGTEPTAFVTVTVAIRATHHYGFRSGEWANLVGVEWANDRPCYRVVFPDGWTDSWPVHDPSDPYEFRRLTSSPENPDG